MGVNSNPKGEGTNQQTPIGQSQASSNDWMNIDGRVAKGTVGSRPDMGADKYGGDKDSGTLFKGSSAAPDGNDRQMNSGKNEKASNNTGQYGSDSKFPKGGVGSREQMPKYGGNENKGNLVGAGAGATKDSQPQDQYKRDLPTQPGQDLVAGTNEDRNRNMSKALKGVGKAGKGGARM